MVGGDERGRTIVRCDGRKARRCHVPIKLDIISPASHPRTAPVNKKGGTCYYPKDADLRLFVLFPACLFCVMAQFTRSEWGEACTPDTTSNTTA